MNSQFSQASEHINAACAVINDLLANDHPFSNDLFDILSKLLDCSSQLEVISDAQSDECKKELVASHSSVVLTASSCQVFPSIKSTIQQISTANGPEDPQSQVALKSTHPEEARAAKWAYRDTDGSSEALSSSRSDSSEWGDESDLSSLIGSSTCSDSSSPKPTKKRTARPAHTRVVTPPPSALSESSGSIEFDRIRSSVRAPVILRQSTTQPTEHNVQGLKSSDALKARVKNASKLNSAQQHKSVKMQTNMSDSESSSSNERVTMPKKKTPTSQSQLENSPPQTLAFITPKKTQRLGGGVSHFVRAPNTAIKAQLPPKSTKQMFFTPQASKSSRQLARPTNQFPSSAAFNIDE